MTDLLTPDDVARKLAKPRMEAAQVVAGHTSSKMTERYITVRDGLLARAADAAQEAIG